MLVQSNQSELGGPFYTKQFSPFFFRKGGAACLTMTVLSQIELSHITVKKNNTYGFLTIFAQVMAILRA